MSTMIDQNMAAVGGEQGNLKSFIPQAGSYPRSAIGWALGNKNVDCCAITMRSFTQLEECVAASGTKLKRTDLAALRTYQKLVDKDYFRVSCSKCETVCPIKVAISYIMRYTMYFQDYHHEKIALQHYQDQDWTKNH